MRMGNGPRAPRTPRSPEGEGLTRNEKTSPAALGPLKGKGLRVMK